jgi:bacteriocin biosynthesis cyclodehydratase domain-containing protein
VPYQTACYSCFALRQKSNLTDYQEYLALEQHLEHDDLRSGALAISPGADLAALEAVKVLSGFVEPTTYGQLFALNLLTLHSELHPVLKIPRCPDCGPCTERPTLRAWDIDEQREQDVEALERGRA